LTDLVSTCLSINQLCAGMLSGGNVDEDGEETVDCRGHPISQLTKEISLEMPYGEAEETDYDNLVLVGVWLAVKENGDLIKNLVMCSDLPHNAED
jgi:hypothetical protein